MTRTSGYSGTPLAKKLGIQAGHRLGLINPPDGFELTLEPLPADLRTSRRAQGRFDVMVFFCQRRIDLEKRFPTLATKLTPSGGLWIGWPKKTSGIATDLSFEAVQGVGLDVGLVDNKVCAIDETWSGLRFVYRLTDRSARTGHQS